MREACQRIKITEELKDTTSTDVLQTLLSGGTQAPEMSTNGARITISENRSKRRRPFAMDASEVINMQIRTRIYSEEFKLEQNDELQDSTNTGAPESSRPLVWIDCIDKNAPIKKCISARY